MPELELKAGSENNNLKNITTDVVVIGAGITGLWLTNVLKNNGINCVLLETDAIGAQQTINSQGMLHSGVKYALQGSVTSDMRAISDSEALSLWQQAFNNPNPNSIKLSENCKLIDQQYLWSNSKLSSKIANFFVSNLLKSKVQKIANNNYPELFKNKQFTGSVYSLHETVLNIPKLLQELFVNIAKYCIKIDSINLELPENNNNKINKFFINIAGEKFLLSAKQYIFTAGEGIAKFTNLFAEGPKMQIRPLHMVAVKSKELPMLYGHNIALQSVPTITVTSHKTADNQVIWYCGGQIAEEGINRTSVEQLSAFKKLLNFVFPWVEFNNAAWGSFLVNRAEHAQPSNGKPHGATWFKLNNAVFAWPTKLVLAPMMVQDIVAYVQQQLLLNKSDLNNNLDHNIINNLELIEQLPKPPIAIPWWASL